MKKLLMASAALAAFVSTSHAADLPTRKGPPAPVLPLFTWTGFYAGVNAGYTLSDNKTNLIGYGTVLNTRANAGALTNSYGTSSNGFIGGVQAGYNYQMGQFVAGVEADIDYNSSTKTSSTSATFAAIPYTNTAKSQLNYLGTVRGRLGFTPIDRFLVFATGGLAYGGVKETISFTGSPSTNGNFYGSKNSTRAGYTIGAGIEYAVTTNWIVKAENLYYDLGKTNVTISDGQFAGTTATYKRNENGHIIRAGVNYKF